MDKSKKRKMMARKVLIVEILFLVILLLGESILAYDWGGGGYSYDPSTGGGTGGGGGGGSPPGEGGDEESTLPDFCEEYNVCTSLTMDIGIYCYLEQRNDPYNTLKVVNGPITWYGYANEGNDKLHLDDSDIEELVEDYLTAQLINEDYFIDQALFLVDEETVAGDGIYEWDDVITHPGIPWFTDPETDDVRLYRFEGKGVSDDENFPAGSGCRVFGGYFLAYNLTAAEMFGIDQNKEDYHNFEPWATPSWEAAPVTEDGEPVGTDIVWDEDADDCKKIAGEDAWFDAEEYEDEDGNAYQCCGDDYIWVNNRPLTEDENGLDVNNLEDSLEKLEDIDDDAEYEAAKLALAADYCLYSTDKNENIIEINYLGSYFECFPTLFNAYDEAVEDAGKLAEKNAEECYDEEGNLLSTCPFLVAMTSDEDTDVGKWSATELEGTFSNPNVCYIKEKQDGVPAFAWGSVNDAGDATGENGYPLTILGEEVTNIYEDREARQLTICEEYLGGTWTGSHCCGNKYDYEDTTTSSYDSDSEAEYVDESYSELTPIYYEDGTSILNTYACAAATAIDDEETATVTGTDGNTYEILNDAGALYGCNIATLSATGKDWYTEDSLITTDTNAAACDIQGSYLCNYNYTNPDNPQWDWYSLTAGDEGKYVKDTLGYSSSSDTFAYSQPAWATADQQPEACCAGNRCWNGDECVDEYIAYDYDTDADGEEEHYLCSEGQWTGELETKYDWYDNTDGAAINYCPESYSCVCSSNEDDDTFCTANDVYVEGGCTLEQDFYTQDHFCEAVDTDNNGDFTDADDTSQWTSRTKLLAFQLMDIAEAEATDYTLFCDNYANALNTWVNVEPIAEDINSFCVLSQNDQITIGVTFNSDDADEPMTVEASNLLFSGSNAFVSDILEIDDVEDCDAALGEDQTSYRFGKFFSCDGTTENIFYNSVLNAVIYSKDGTGTTKLNYPTDDFASYQNSFDDSKQTILDHLDAETIENPAGDPLEEDFASFGYVQDYNRIYYAEKSGTSVFGFEDIKYDGETGNRYYLGVVYDGITIDCDQIYAPYETTLKIYCSSSAGIVLERSTTGSEYWNSLTAALRLE